VATGAKSTLVKLMAVGDKGRRKKWERGKCFLAIFAAGQKSFPADFCFHRQLLHFFILTS